jgi:hypothetical protein
MLVGHDEATSKYPAQEGGRDKTQNKSEEISDNRPEETHIFLVETVRYEPPNGKEKNINITS